MNDPRSASTTGTDAFLPDKQGPRFIGQIAAGAREARLVGLLALALVVSAALGLLIVRTLASRGRVVCYVPELKRRPTIPIESESP